jgi:chromosome segregation ATPase
VADQILPFLQTGLPIQSEELGRIGDLDPPDELQAAFDEAQQLNRQRQELIQQATDRIEAGEDPEAVIDEVRGEIADLQEQARAKARELGLTVCGASDDDAGAGTVGTTGAGTAGTAPSAERQRYGEDLQEAGAALQEFGTIVRGTSSLEDFRGSVPEAEAALDDFEAAIDDLNGYELREAALEARRAELVPAGREAVDVLRRFLAAAKAGDAQTVQSLGLEATQAIAAFGRAAGVTP